MNIHYKTNMNTQHNEYQHVITKNVFKHNFLGTLNIFDVTSYKGSIFCCFNPSVSPLQLCPVIWATPLSCFQDANWPTVMPIWGILILSVSMTSPRKTTRFSSGFLVQCAKSGVKDPSPFLTLLIVLDQPTANLTWLHESTGEFHINSTRRVWIPSTGQPMSLEDIFGASSSPRRLENG